MSRILCAVAVAAAIFMLACDGSNGGGSDVGDYDASLRDTSVPNLDTDDGEEPGDAELDAQQPPEEVDAEEPQDVSAPDIGSPDGGEELDVAPIDVGEVEDIGPMTDGGPAEPDTAEPGNDLYEPGGPPEGDEGLIPGTGIDEFEALVQGATLRWEQGMQGGFHIWGWIRASGEPFSNFSDEELGQFFEQYNLFDQEGELIATTNRYGFATMEQGELQSGGYTVIMRRTLDVQEQVGGPYELVVTIDVGSEQSWETRVWVYLECCDFL